MNSNSDFGGKMTNSNKIICAVINEAFDLISELTDICTAITRTNVTGNIGNEYDITANSTVTTYDFLGLYVVVMSPSTLCSTNKTPFLFYENSVRCRPILLIFGINKPEGICSMSAITYLLKNW